MRQNLLIDADDTLWDNNIYFEQATHDFMTFLNHSQLTKAEVQAVIDEFEKTLGYGVANFTNSLVATYRQLAEKEVSEDDVSYIRQLGEQIHTHPLELLDGVAETLHVLAARHTLFLLTKGDQEEQQIKVERSGVESFFKHILIVPEKNVTTYQNVISELDLDPHTTWMIGNSPRSDINPALAAGLNAVFIPHANTWHLEHEEVASTSTGQLLTLSRFTELQDHF